MLKLKFRLRIVFGMYINEGNEKVRERAELAVKKLNIKKLKSNSKRVN